MPKVGLLRRMPRGETKRDIQHQAQKAHVHLLLIRKQEPGVIEAFLIYEVSEHVSKSLEWSSFSPFPFHIIKTPTQISMSNGKSNSQRPREEVHKNRRQISKIATAKAKCSYYCSQMQPQIAGSLRKLLKERERTRKCSPIAAYIAAFIALKPGEGRSEST
jgi:hypothetical protein